MTGVISSVAARKVDIGPAGDLIGTRAEVKSVVAGKVSRGRPPPGTIDGRYRLSKPGVKTRKQGVSRDILQSVGQAHGSEIP